MFAVMSSKRYRAGTMTQTRFADNRDLWRPTVERYLAEGRPLQFVLPSFPFKHANPFKDSRHSPDMGEILCLTRLFEICQAIQRVYPPGAQFVIIADGLAYHAMFGITYFEAIQYREEVQRLIMRLGFDSVDTMGIRRGRTIPASAGSTSASSRVNGSRPDHPRERGEHYVVCGHLPSSALLGRVRRGRSSCGDELEAGAASAGPDTEQGLEFAEDGVESQAGARAFGSWRNCVQKAWARAVSVTWRCQPT